MAGVDLQELLMNALAENRPAEATAEQAARAAEERAKMLAVVEGDLLMDVRRYDHDKALTLLKDVRRVFATGDDLRRLAEAFLIRRGAKIRPADVPGMVKISSVPPELQRPGVRPEYERATFDRSVARGTRPDDVDLIAFGHPLFDAIIEECRALELRAVAAVKRVASVQWAGVKGILAGFILEFTDGMNQTVARRFYQVFVDATGQSRPELVAEIRVLAGPPAEPPALSPDLAELAANAAGYAESAVRLAHEAAAVVEEEVQDSRSRLVGVMRSDLDTYAKVKEGQLKSRLSEARRRIHEVQEQMPLSGDDGERPRLESTLRLREYDLQEAERELERLRAKVQRRSEELGNMEIVVDEEPRLVSLALVELVSPKEG